MKIGDYVLNRELLEQAEKNLQEMTKKDKEFFTVLVKSSCFLAEMFFEVFESKTVDDLNIIPEDRLRFGVQLLAQASSLCCLKLASKSNNVNIIIKNYQRMFQNIINNAVDSGGVN